jgi:hypothetical protein
MSFAEFAIAVRTSADQSQVNNPPEAWYMVLALLAAVMGLVVLMFIRTTTRPRRSKR